MFIFFLVNNFYDSIIASYSNITVNVEKSWTFPKKSWISTQKKLGIDPKKVGHKKH